jgi:hypothetical protein
LKKKERKRVNLLLCVVALLIVVSTTALLSFDDLVVGVCDDIIELNYIEEKLLNISLHSRHEQDQSFLVPARKNFWSRSR